MNKLKELICQYFPEHDIDDSSILIYTIELFYVGYSFFFLVYAKDRSSHLYS